MKKLPYREGSIFALPLRSEGYAIGVVARSSNEGKVILAYLYGPKRTKPPALDEVLHLKPTDAVKVFRIGDLGLIKGEWPIVGRIGRWNRSDWPMPPYVRRDELSNRATISYYSEEDPVRLLKSEAIESEHLELERDSVLGYGAVEVVLTKLLEAC